MKRRQFLDQLGSGFGGLALAGMLQTDGLLAATASPGIGGAVEIENLAYSSW